MRSHDFLLVLLALSVGSTARAAEIVRLSPENFAALAPPGKEAEAAFGDYVLMNDRVLAVVAQPTESRQLNHRIHKVGGGLIDFTPRAEPNDQLTAFFPGGQLDTKVYNYDRRRALNTVEAFRNPDQSVTLTCATSPADPSGVRAVVRYTLADGADAILVESIWVNESQEPREIELVDEFAPEKNIEFDEEGTGQLVWASDPWWKQAWGVLSESHPIHHRPITTPWYLAQPLRFSYGPEKAVLQPGGEYSLKRWVIVARDVLGVRQAAAQLRKQSLVPTTLEVADSHAPVVDAQVTLLRGDDYYGVGKTGADGRITTSLPPGAYKLAATALGRTRVEGSFTVPPEVADPSTVRLEMDRPGYVVAKVTDDQNQPIPCKVQFFGREGVKDPFFFSDSGEHQVHNCYYSHDGVFRQPLGPGEYEVVVSYGPEYDAVFTQIKVQRGVETDLRAVLRRTVDTTGWVSADFHNHATPSGDNNASQLGRVLNLLCEHIEFAPCTEHNTLDDYAPYLRRLGAEQRMATVVGVEVTSSPFTIGHQNAFPIRLRPGERFNGAPPTDKDPLRQIEALRAWDDASPKLVQQNHPNLVQIAFDRNLDGREDEGLRPMIAHMDVVELTVPHFIFNPVPSPGGMTKGVNVMEGWLRMLDRGFRVPGVYNSDAHYNFHGSGWVRNYVKSPTDAPGRIQVSDIIRHASAGHVVISTGPFLEVTAEADGKQAIPGDEIAAPDGNVRLHIRVQCANWLDINRVQVFINGQPDPRWNYTRATHPGRFNRGVVKFDQTLNLKLEQDAHVIVAVVDEHRSLAPVILAPERGEEFDRIPPAAMANPIFVVTRPSR